MHPSTPPELSPPDITLLLASIAQGVLLFGPDERLQYYNARANEILELPADLLAARPHCAEIAAALQTRGICDFGALLAPVPGALPASPAESRQLSTWRMPDGRTVEVQMHHGAEGSRVCTFSDISAYAQAQSERLHLHELLKTTQAVARVGGWEVDRLLGTVVWTEGVYLVLETSPQEFSPSVESVQRFYTPQTQAVLAASWADNANEPASHDFEIEMRTYRGRSIWVHSRGTTYWQNGRAVRRVATIQDITERRQAQQALLESEQRWKLALDSAGDGVWDWHIVDNRRYSSRRLQEMFGFEEADDFDQTPVEQRVHPEDLPALQRARQEHFQGTAPTFVVEHRVSCKDGSWKWVLSRGMVISRDAQGAPVRMLGTHTDITARKESERLIWEQAHFDALTGLPNRRMLRDRLEQEIKHCRRESLQLALLFIDLDHFKEINDTLGHASGDLLLIEAARRIRTCVRDTDTVARMGGDEFTVILSDINPGTSLQRILQDMLRALETVFQLGHEQAFVSASIGIAVYPLDGNEIEDLFKHADQALYVAKGTGRNRFSFFTPTLQEAAQRRLRLATDLRQGLSERQFHVVYQPIVDLRDSSIHKAEVLLRWEHPTLGPISPADFIPIAEASGQIVDIGEWVFRQAAVQVGVWRSTLHAQFQISVNKSPVQFQHGGGTPWFAQLQSRGLPGSAIVVEITEGLLLDSSASVAEQLLELHDAEIQVSLDDFGTGYSSLSYLQKFDIDFIKIDKSFVRHLIPDSTDLALCKAIIVMAHALDMRVVAEGVETELQRELLAAAGCDYAQGYLFAKPMPVVEFERFIAARTLP